jgi:hypothetical protein
MKVPSDASHMRSVPKEGQVLCRPFQASSMRRNAASVVALQRRGDSEFPRFSANVASRFSTLQITYFYTMEKTLLQRNSARA